MLEALFGNLTQVAEALGQSQLVVQLQETQTGKKIGGLPPRDPEQAVPDPKAQKSFTDPESRIMLDGATKSFQLTPLLMAVEANTGRQRVLLTRSRSRTTGHGGG